MTRALTIVGLGGSLARVSRSRAALQLALGGAASAGAETTLFDLRELALPMYDPDDEEPAFAAAYPEPVTGSRAWGHKLARRRPRGR